MTSAGDAGASASAVGQRASQRSQRGTTRSTCVCCAITSLTRTAYGSRVFRHGRSRELRRYQSRSSASMAGDYAGAVIDLRSDTLTKPTAGMRAAMAAAAVGAGQYLEDPKHKE